MKAQRERSEYEESLKKYRDLKGVIDTSFEEGEKIGFDKGFDSGEKIGFDKGKDEKARQMAKLMKDSGIPIDKIANFSGLSPDEIDKL